ncbi:MAG: betaine--homocysteine S-methyltransferase [Alphaproteobacteria bacterium]|nr:betaine--homocysteine S-methyltransferase [Alphaproteobacteria bacterium]
MSVFHELLDEKSCLLADGATGTNYFNLGLETGYPPELWNVEEPDHVLGLHRDFLAAGSDLILTNSFGGTGYRLKLHQAEDRVAELNTAAARLARTAVDAHQQATGQRAVVAGSMGPSGELFEPLGALTHADAVAAFTAQAEALAEGGVDLLWIETISAFEEVDAAYEAAASTGLPVAATMTFDTAGKSMMGVDPAAYAGHVGGKGAVALGANCGVGPSELMHSMMAMRGQTKAALVAKGNCGIPEYRDGKIHYHGSPELMASYAVLARDAGVAIIGGCCGTTPDHIRAMRHALDTTPVTPIGDVAARMDQIWQVLGQPWAHVPHVPDQPSPDDDASGGRRRRRRS